MCSDSQNHFTDTLKPLMIIQEAASGEKRDTA